MTLFQYWIWKCQKNSWIKRLTHYAEGFLSLLMESSTHWTRLTACWNVVGYCLVLLCKFSYSICWKNIANWKCKWGTVIVVPGYSRYYSAITLDRISAVFPQCHAGMVYVVSVSVCPSVCLLQVRVLPKWLNASLCKQCRMIARESSFPMPKILAQFLSRFV